MEGCDARIMSVIGPIVVALVYISLCSLFGEPSRQNFNAIMVAGAGAAYLNGGFGIWEFAFTVAVALCAFRGLGSYNWIGAGWLLHTGWDCVAPSTGWDCVAPSLWELHRTVCRGLFVRVCDLRSGDRALVFRWRTFRVRPAAKKEARRTQPGAMRKSGG